MTQEDKELLLVDLSARLPYKVKVKDTYYNDEPATIWILDLNAQKVRIFADEGYQSIEYIKPYLFPMSSMTEEQDKEYALLQTSAGKDGFLYAWNCANMVQWLNKNHFDYRGLIEKGLAIDATDKNIY